MGRLEGRVALITGGARGQGAAEAELFAKEGAKVVFGDVLDAEGLAVETAIREVGVARYIHCDVTSSIDWAEAVRLAEVDFGGLDILVNNAAVMSFDGLLATTSEVWDWMMEVNVKGVFLGCQAVVPSMRSRGGGSIVNISSVAGLVGQSFPAYGASKGAVRLLTKCVAIEFAPDKIRCNSIHPGGVETQMVTAVTETPDQTETRLAGTPLRRRAQPVEIAHGALFLASDESTFMTGSELVIDGGRTAW